MHRLWWLRERVMFVVSYQVFFPLPPHLLSVPSRVPKVGSETIWKLLDLLAQQNGFHSYSDSMEVKSQRGGENNYLPGLPSRRAYFDMLNEKAERPYSYCKHLNFIDFREDFNVTNPVYINFVRDPVERVISWCGAVNSTICHGGGDHCPNQYWLLVLGMYTTWC